jgi:hypothetical protein
MKPFLASILTVIAGGVLLIAYGLLVPRTPRRRRRRTATRPRARRWRIR